MLNTVTRLQPHSSADKPRYASVSVARNCNSELAAISRYISEAVQASAKVTTECEYVIICRLSNGTSFDDSECPRTRVSRLQHFSKSNILITVRDSAIVTIEHKSEEYDLSNDVISSKLTDPNPGR